MEHDRKIKPVASFLVFLNLCMYAVVLGISGWAMNRLINYGTVGYGQNGATLYFILFSLLAGAVGAVSCLFGLNHAKFWCHDSLHAASATAAVAWSLTVLALGFACKHIRLHTHSHRLKTLEAFIIILSGTMLLYIGAIHGAIKRST